MTKRRWNLVGWVVFRVIGLVGFAGLMLRAANMVLDGRGAETYRTFWRVESDRPVPFDASPPQRLPQ